MTRQVHGAPRGNLGLRGHVPARALHAQMDAAVLTAAASALKKPKRTTKTAPQAPPPEADLLPSPQADLFD